MKRKGYWAGLGLLVSAGVAWACGPFFPERMLLERSKSLLQAPRSRLSLEVASMKVKTPPVKANWAPGEQEFPQARQTVEVDVAELAEALRGKAEGEAIVKRYRAVRGVLWSLTVQPANGGGGALVPALAPPDGIPGEFADYLRGAIARARGDSAGAKKEWEGLLARPAAERGYRSTWAAYMLGVHSRDVNRAEAARWFQKTRELAAQGFRDGLGLGAASLGAEGALALADRDFPRASRLYLEASALGDPFGSASITVVVRALMEATPEAQKQALRDPVVREVLGAYLTSTDVTELGPSSRESRIHALLLDETRDERDMAGADRLAWFSYQRGDLKATEAWLQRAPESSPVRAWIRSKMLARGGKYRDAAAELTRAVEAFPLLASTPLQDEESPRLIAPRRLRAELAVLKLGRGQFLEAHELLLRAGYWRDAAFVAERVLSLEELRAHVDERWPPAPRASAGKPAEPAAVEPMSDGERLRYLLGRRLARADRWTEARPYFPPALLPDLDAYLVAREKSKAPGAQERAEALWAMARLERHKGMELLGMELGPDWRVDDGQFDEDEAVGKPSKREPAALRSGEEQRREKQSAPAFARRFHYRHVGARRALEASKLLADRDPRIQEMLCSAFDWLKARDPQGARPYAQEAKRRGVPCP
ncbi:MAG: hypothetical protein MUF64_02840 [Polyangiaceae bacterium]|nr:hypothetical protein [Polyangiaceae bacterium]